MARSSSPLPHHFGPNWLRYVPLSKRYIFSELDSEESVVAVHCNHGKGRTGSAIIGFMILVGYFHHVNDSLKYYNCKRFNDKTYGVDQPCQIRYLKYLEELVINKKINPKLICYKINKITSKGLN